MTIKRTILFILAVTLATACTSSSSSPSPSSYDASADLACTHFQNIVSDYTDGILTRDELRTKMVEVESDARNSDTPGVALAAKEVLAGLTARDYDRAAEGVTRLTRACLAGRS